ncbi:Cytochrome C assembly protein [Planctomycetes bacterium CA13]|uniref:Cytochrome C assembly protein n=1 Tax=Novipirellula herctigrandis TaxID=2527986 RepID=A0A5C5Z5T6_9BACT|nr:Cytochrome C assembly protein [Planctomycetes bacterium CA13]
MLVFLGKISVTCFFASYIVVLILELLRFFGKIPGRGLAVIVMMSLGLFTHICYLVLRAVARGATSDVGMLASWYDWSLLVALGLAICFLIFYLRRPDTVIGIFFMPLVLATIGLSLAVRPMAPFSRSEAADVWRSIHGISMAVGAGGVLIGFLAGVMYLAQSWRLKNKRAGSSLRLPTLETLARLNRQCLVVSTTAVAVGVIAGAVMNLNRWGQVGWTSGGVLFSFGLLLWLTVATCVEYFYAPASQGRKAFYLTLASLGFLVLAFFGVLNSPHGRTVPVDQASVVSEDAA